MNKLLLVVSLVLVNLTGYSQTKPAAAPTKTPAAKPLPVKRGKLAISSDADCNFTFNDKAMGPLKAGKTKTVAGTFGENTITATLGLTPPPAPAAKGSAAPADKNKKPTAELVTFTTKVQIQDTAATPFLIEFYGEKMFYEYIRSGNKTMIDEVLKKTPALIKPSGDFSINPLVVAAEKNKKEVIELLLNKGADVNYKIDETPLNAAIRSGNLEIVKLFLEKGAKITVRGDDGTTPLWEAITWNKFEIAKLLLEKGANPNEKSANDQTPIQYAIDKGLDSMVQELKKYGAQE